MFQAISFNVEITTFLKPGCSIRLTTLTQTSKQF